MFFFLLVFFLQLNGDVRKESVSSDAKQLESQQPQPQQQQSQDEQGQKVEKEREEELKSELESGKSTSLKDEHKSSDTTDAPPTAIISGNDVDKTSTETNESHNLDVIPSKEVTGIRLPRRFATYSCNSKETWQPALFLEEPSDPQRVCHYAKNIVYPPSTGMEYSPEEIKARRYKYHHPSTLKNQMAEMISNNIQKNNIAHLYEQQPTSFSKELVNHFGKRESSLNDSTVVDQLKIKINDDGKSQEERETMMQKTDQSKDLKELDKAADVQQQQQQPVNNKQDINDKVVVAPPSIRFTSTDCSQNKTIKIKFKKDRSIDGSESSNAYKIERIYQPEVSSRWLFSCI